MPREPASSRSDKIGPTTGLTGIVLVLGGLIASGTPPQPDATDSRIVSFYSQSQGTQELAGIALGVGAVLFLVFSATLAARLGSGDAETGAYGALCLVGAGVLVVGLTIFASLALALSQVGDEIDAPALVGLNVLNQDMFFPVSVGASAFMLGAGAAVLRGGMFPIWLGWFAIVSGVVAAMPSHVLGGVLDHIGLFGVVGLAVWTVIVSIIGLRKPWRPASH